MADKVEKVINAKDFDVNPDLKRAVDPEESPMKEWLVDYVGNKLNPENGEVTVEMIVGVMTDEFPEFVLAVAEENFIRGYCQGVHDEDFGRTVEKREKMLKRQFGEGVVEAVQGALEERMKGDAGNDN